LGKAEPELIFLIQHGAGLETDDSPRVKLDKYGVGSVFFFTIDSLFSYSVMVLEWMDFDGRLFFLLFLPFSSFLFYSSPLCALALLW